MRHVIAINQQRAEATGGNFDSMFAILQQIQQFSSEKWAMEVSFAYSSLGPEQELHTQTVANTQPDILDWRLIGEVYQAAVALYCISSLIIPGMGFENVAATLERSKAIGLAQESCWWTLLKGLKAVASNKVRQLRKLVLWPLVIAGIVSRGEGAEVQSFILDELSHVSRALGTASPLVARDLLSRLWARHRSGPRSMYREERSWDDLFDRSYCFAV